MLRVQDVYDVSRAAARLAEHMRTAEPYRTRVTRYTPPAETLDEFLARTATSDNGTTS